VLGDHRARRRGASTNEQVERHWSFACAREALGPLRLGQADSERVREVLDARRERKFDIALVVEVANRQYHRQR
jgi:hypothetical protein